jgi:glycosyltransferase involved in cell wall biosynthesis
MLGIDQDAFQVGWVGRLSPEKGPDLLLEALGMLRGLPARASIIGDGHESASLRTRCRVLGIEDRVCWHGVVRSAGRVLRAFDVLVLSSRREGTPMVLFEAMAAEVPIVATSVGGVPDVLTPAEAWLVPADNAHALASAIRDAVTNRAAACQRAKAARHRLDVAHRSHEWVSRYEEVYDRACRRVAARSAF